VVLEHGTGVSKGVGYVSFAIAEDAKAAFDHVSVEGMTLDGRCMRVEWAANRVCSRASPFDESLPNVNPSPAGQNEITKALPPFLQNEKQIHGLRITYPFPHEILLLFGQWLFLASLL